MIKRTRFKSGFTLIEMLVAIGILGIVAILGSQMFFTILKGSAKSRVLADVKQNGNYALSVMSRMIRNARSVTDCSGISDKAITIVSPDKEITEFKCADEKIASRSASAPPKHSPFDLTGDQVQVVDCGAVFTCDPTVTPNLVTISFTLVPTTGTRIEETAEVNFKTTISLRTY
ncbi:MAG TPA: type II secretion system protein [Candidatus Bathyarchaeia archaeon]|nr:type II secretion system protein [Candidatus Bathyarchaeia archaeon]